MTGYDLAKHQQSLQFTPQNCLRGMEGTWDPEQLIMQVDASCSSLELLIASLKKKKKKKERKKRKTGSSLL